MPSEGQTQAIPQALIDRVRAGRANLVVGLGCAALAGLPGWPETLRRIGAHLGSQDAKRARKVVEELLGRGRRSAALAYLRGRVPPPALAEALREAFPPGLPVPEALALVAGLPWRAVLLTGFDDLWDRALAAAPQPFSRLETLPPSGGPPALPPGCFLHVLGSPDQADTLCLAPGDLRRGERSTRLVPLVREAFRERSLVLIGFEPDDPDLNLLVHGLLGGAPSTAEHFFLWAGAPSTPAVLEVVKAELDVTVVPCGADLEELARRLVEAYRPFAGEPPPSDEDRTGPPGTLPEMVEATLRQIDDSADPGRKGEIYVEVARILEERLEDANQGGDDPATGEGASDDRPETFEALTRLFRALEDWRACVAALDKWALALRDGSAAADAYLRAGEILAERLSDDPAAEARYLRALAVDPGNRGALTALAGVALRRQDHGDAVRLLLEAEQGHARRALRACALASRRATGPAPLLTAARLTQATGEWGEAARLYEEALAAGVRAPAEAQHQLGLCRASLGDRATAMTAFELALVADRGHRPAREALADALLAQGDHAAWDKHMRVLAAAANPPAADRPPPDPGGATVQVIAHHQQQIAADPDRLASYRALADLYRGEQSADALAGVAGTLCFLRKATPELQALHEARQPRGPLVASARPPAAVWRRICHPGEASAIGQVLALLGPVVLEAFAAPAEALGLTPDERAADGDERPACRILLAACEALGVAPPAIYFSGTAVTPAVCGLREDGRALPAVICAASLARPGADGNPAVELPFVLARAAAWLRPEALLRRLAARGLAADETRTGALPALLRAALVLGDAYPAPRPQPPAVTRLVEQLRPHLTADAAAAVGEAGRRLIAERGETPGLLGWLAGVDLTAGRMAFALGAELGTAARVLGSEPADASPLPPKRRLRDLVAFSVSEDQLVLRRALSLVPLSVRSSPI
jgi:tetratricopeptide (TPR) repeat protein